MAKQTIDRGTGAGNGDGEVLYDAFGKVNANFTELYDYDTSLGQQGGAALVGNTPVTGIAATTVQGAINELNTEKAPAPTSGTLGTPVDVAGVWSLPDGLVLGNGTDLISIWAQALMATYDLRIDTGGRSAGFHTESSEVHNLSGTVSDLWGMTGLISITNKTGVMTNLLSPARGVQGQVKFDSAGATFVEAQGVSGEVRLGDGTILTAIGVSSQLRAPTAGQTVGVFKAFSTRGAVRDNSATISKYIGLYVGFDNRGSFTTAYTDYAGVEIDPPDANHVVSGTTKGIWLKGDDLPLVMGAGDEASLYLNANQLKLDLDNKSFDITRTSTSTVNGGAAMRVYGVCDLTGTQYSKQTSTVINTTKTGTFNDGTGIYGAPFIGIDVFGVPGGTASDCKYIGINISGNIGNGSQKITHNTQLLISPPDADTCTGQINAIHVKGTQTPGDSSGAVVAFGTNEEVKLYYNGSALVATLDDGATEIPLTLYPGDEATAAGVLVYPSHENQTVFSNADGTLDYMTCSYGGYTWTLEFVYTAGNVTQMNADNGAGGGSWSRSLTYNADDTLATTGVWA